MEPIDPEVRQQSFTNHRGVRTKLGLLLLVATCFVCPAVSRADDAISAGPTYRDEDRFARVFIYRERRDIGGLLTPTVLLGKDDFVDLPDGSYVRSLLPPGHYEFQMDDRGSGAQFDLEAGDAVYMKVDIIPGFWKGGGRLTVMAPEQGSFEIRSLRRVDEVDARKVNGSSSNEERARITKGRMLSIANGIISPTSKEVPDPRSKDELQAYLRRVSSLQIQPVDEWGTDFRYVRAEDGKSALLVSAGADKVFDETSWTDSNKALHPLGADAVLRIHPQGGDFVRVWTLDDSKQVRKE